MATYLMGMWIALGLSGKTLIQEDAPTSTPAQRLIFARTAAEGYRFRLPDRDESAVTLQPEPLLRWNNQVIREDDGMLFLWTEGAGGRPVAAAQFFVNPKFWHHEFQSLSPGRFDARLATPGGAEWSWRPAAAGLEFVAADDVDPPAASPGGRLRQMKRIAERFGAEVDLEGRFEAPEQLRLLTTPLYRYADEAQGLQDGAMFAFTQGTNPEILILIEARGEEPAAGEWRYGFARMSCFHLRVHRGDQVVWKRDREPVPTPRPDSPYSFRLNAQPDESDQVAVPPAKSK